MTPSVRARTMPFGAIMPSNIGEGAREVTFSWQAAQRPLKISAPFESSIAASTGACTAAGAVPASHRTVTMASKACTPMAWQREADTLLPTKKDCLCSLPSVKKLRPRGHQNCPYALRAVRQIVSQPQRLGRLKAGVGDGVNGFNTSSGSRDRRRQPHFLDHPLERIRCGCSEIPISASGAINIHGIGDSDLRFEGVVTKEAHHRGQ